ncbi:PorP/SprF family type IX secretion system membrane protein [Maribacter sp. IgM3_T14_3]|uniref:PorP/SprF family type IX secretion system membrane protein n=1 Tax=Maribacter sp. IgM3_T14_3 TaxID=3415140 RepID=UPI003C6FAA79
MKKVVLLLCILFLSSFHSKAQQDPEYTQYMYNMSVINPAYATNDVGVANLGLLYRTQWVGAVGAPKTATAFIRTPLSEQVEAGISIIHDEIGDGALNEDNIYADFAYLVQLNRSMFLSFGLKAGVTLFDTRFNDFQLNSGDFSSDPAFSENINETFLNIGTGLFLFNDDFYVGLSAPNLLGSKHIEEQNGINALGAENLHIFLTGGYVFEINRGLKFKPSFMVKRVSNTPLSMDINANFLFNDTLEAGLSYRVDDAVSAMVNVAITPDLRIGYAYDYTTSNLGNFNSGTHEFMLLYNLRIAGAKRFTSPRFF